jgi:hypothetical protein
MKIRLNKNLYVGGFNSLPLEMAPGSVFFDIDNADTYIFDKQSESVKMQSIDPNHEHTLSQISDLTGVPDGTKFLRDDGSWVSLTGGGDALIANPLSQFAATTKAQLNGVISDGTPLYVGDITGVTTELKPVDINTLAKLNAIVADATLINTTDSRLSDARTPTSHTHTFADISSISGTPNGSKFLRDDGVWSLVPVIGDMLKSTYDPTNISGDVFDMDNMVAGAINDILTIEDHKQTHRSASSGVISFAGFTVATATTFDIGEVKAQFIDYTDPENPSITTYTRAASAGVTDPLVATANITYVLMTNAGVLEFVGTEPAPSDYTTHKVFLGQIGHPDRTTITSAFSFAANIQNPSSQIRELMYGLGPIVKSGLTFEASALGMTVSRDAGVVVDLGIGSKGNEPFSPIPHTTTIPVLDPVSSFLYVASDQSNVAATVIDPDNYDPNGSILSLVAVASNKFTVQYIVVFKGGFTNIQYGQTEYNSLNAARDAVIAGEDYTFAPVILESALIRTALILKSGITGNLSDAVTAGTAAFYNYGKLGLGAGGGGASGSAGTTMQITYGNSTIPQITTNAISGEIIFKSGTGNDADTVFGIRNNAGGDTVSINGSGDIVANSITTGIVGITGTKAQFDVALTDSNFMGGSIADNQIAIGNGSNLLDGSSDLTWDRTNMSFIGASTDRYIRFAETVGQFNGGFIWYEGLNNQMHIGVHATGDALPANDIKVITIPRANGRVGIKNINPTYDLDVTGVIKCTGARIEPTWTQFEGRFSTGGTPSFGASRLGDSDVQSASYDIGTSLNWIDGVVAQQVNWTMFENNDVMTLRAAGGNYIGVLDVNGANNATSGVDDAEATIAQTIVYSDTKTYVNDLGVQRYEPGASDVAQAHFHIMANRNGAARMKYYWAYYDGTTYDEIMRVDPTTRQSTWAQDLLVPDEAYNETNWNASLEVPTKNAVRDKIDAMDTAIALNTAKDDLTGAEIETLLNAELGNSTWSAGIVTDTPTTVLSLDNPAGRYSNMGVANTNTTFTTTGTENGAWCKVLINAATQPTVDAKVANAGATFIPSTDMYMIVEYVPTRGVEFFFQKIAA